MKCYKNRKMITDMQVVSYGEKVWEPLKISQDIAEHSSTINCLDVSGIQTSLFLIAYMEL